MPSVSAIMMKFQVQSVWRRLNSKQLFYLIIMANMFAVIFEGYAQGVLGGVNSSPDFIRIMDLSDSNDYSTATKTLKLGGLTSCYYLGAIFGSLLSGWLSDQVGRLPTLQMGSLWCMLGTALEAGAQNTNMCVLTLYLRNIRD